MLLFGRYSGNACDACSPGYSKSSGLCQSLYINGTSVNSRLPAFARASHLDKLEGNGKSANSSSIIWIAVGCIGAFTICGACILLLLVRKRRRNQSYMVHRDRRSSRKTQQVSFDPFCVYQQAHIFDCVASEQGKPP